MPDAMTPLTDFLLQLDQLKLINRRTYSRGGERLRQEWQSVGCCPHSREIMR
ncbi:MAG: hypothetical protein R3175_07300 [Marinobacter sp.]|uniref:hypothetical protein n=1 Tax=Marinobacter sp. TaxID=50741 RepID=UPI00299E8E2D|nr:hypothetical protein [Marinobacter sp.]MDX1755847.1 hypothetical protein [Marinobacter sp.]